MEFQLWLYFSIISSDMNSKIICQPPIWGKDLVVILVFQAKGLCVLSYLVVGWDGGDSGEDKAEQTSRDQITEGFEWHIKSQT